jgi:DNA invertase Pin-like site-specific DNA recombinase
MIMTVFAGIAEFERDLIRERTGAGRAAARSAQPLSPEGQGGLGNRQNLQCS